MEDVATIGYEIVITPMAKAVMDRIAAGADADGPSVVRIMLLDKDCEEGGEDNDMTNGVMWELWRDGEDEDDGGEVKGEDGNGRVIDDEEDGGEDDNDNDDDIGGGSDQGGPPLRIRVDLRHHRGEKGQTVQAPHGEGRGGR